MTILITNWILSIIINTISLLFHMLGIHVIRNALDQNTNQPLILLNLSLIEGLMNVYAIVNDVIRLNKYWNVPLQDGKMLHAIMANKLPPVYQEISLMFYCLHGMQIIIIMTILSVDRLICAINSFKYRVYVTERRTKVTLIASWLCSIGIGVLYAFYPHSMIIPSTVVVLAGLYVVLTICTYSVIIYKIRNSTRKFSQGSINPRRKDARKKFLVPGVILTTFIFLYLVPLSLMKFVLRGHGRAVNRTTVIVHEWLAILVDIGCVSDALIYIFLTKQFRVLLSRRKQEIHQRGVYVTRRLSRCVSKCSRRCRKHARPYITPSVIRDHQDNPILITTSL